MYATTTRVGFLELFFEECFENGIIDLGTKMEVTYQILPNLAEQRPPAEPPKFWPRSTRGRKFKVGILSSN